jgi:plasmid maintenance system antidote protein VapI
LDIYTHETWESYFAEIIKKNGEDRGYKTKLAQAAKVHPSYISRMLEGLATVSPDQAAALGDFWSLSPKEKQYLIWLVIKAKAGTPELKRMADEHLAECRREQEELGNHLEAEKFSADDHTEYYLDWIHSAVHMLGTLRDPLSPEQLARRLGVKEIHARRSVALLTRMGLVEPGPKGKVISTKKNIHLSNRGWIANLQHRNWRLACAERFGGEGEDDHLHYTGVHSLSKEDFARLKRQIREFLVQTDRLIRPSPEETACVLCLDLVEL